MTYNVSDIKLRPYNLSKIISYLGAIGSARDDEAKNRGNILQSLLAQELPGVDYKILITTAADTHAALRGRFDDNVRKGFVREITRLKPRQ